MNISGIKLQPGLFRHRIYKSIYLLCSCKALAYQKGAVVLGYSVSYHSLVEGAPSIYGLDH